MTTCLRRQSGGVYVSVLLLFHAVYYLLLVLMFYFSEFKDLMREFISLKGLNLLLLDIALFRLSVRTTIYLWGVPIVWRSRE